MPTSSPSPKPPAKSSPASTAATAKATKTASTGNAPVEAPATWLAKINEFPITDSHLEELELKYPFDVFLALLESPNAVKAAQFGILSSKYEGQDFLDWLCELSKEIASRYSARGCSNYRERLYVALQADYGEDTYAIKSGKSTTAILNQIHCAAFFTFYNRIEFDDSIGCYFQYLPEQGRWHDISEVEVREQFTRFIVPFMADNPYLYTGRDRDMKEILAHTKAIGRHHDFELPETKLILVKNGTVFVDTSAKGKTTPQLGGWSPMYKLRNQIPLRYDPQYIGCTSFRKFLSDMIDGGSKDDIALLQYWCGMVLLGRNDLHKIMVLTGSAGSGKSTFLNLLEKAIGQDNVSTLVTQRLEERFELSEFFGKTLLIGKDVSPNALNNRASHMLKSLSGDSGIKAEVKHIQRRVTLGGPFHICLMSNSKLTVGVKSDADAWERRLWVIHTSKPSPAPTPIPNYEDVLLKNEGSGILYWMVEGVQEVLKYKRLKLTKVLNPLQAARVTSLINGGDSIEQFVIDQIMASPGSTITSSDLHLAYCDYCAKNDVDTETNATFTRRIGRTLNRHHPTSTHKNVSKTAGGLAKGYTDIKLK